MAEKPVRILVMDDDAGQARLAQRTLERAGYTVEVAGDGATGLALHAARAYDVLMVDHQMPGTGGLDVLRTLATRGTLPPTIMVTGHGDEAVAVEAMKLGAGDYLVKDVEGRYLTLLPTVVGRVLYQQRLLEEKRQAEATLQQTLAELETRVQERTAALQQANAHLQAEIAERMRAEAALAQLNRRHRLILDSAGEGIYGVDLEGRTTFVNPAAARMLGWAVEELLGQPMHDLVCHTTRDGMPRAHDACPIRAACRDGVVRHVPEEVFWRKDGTPFFVEYVGTPIHEHDTLVGAVIIFRDITERRRIEREMQRADRLALVGQLASGLAHEIGTPLNIIAGNAELLGMDLRDRVSAPHYPACRSHYAADPAIVDLCTDQGTAHGDTGGAGTLKPTRSVCSRPVSSARTSRSGWRCRRRSRSSTAAPNSLNKCSSMCSLMPGMPCPTVAPSPLPPL